MSDELDTIVAADNDKYMIRCENLVKIYKTSDVEVVALQGLDLDVERGELMAIVGNSGSGKSTTPTPTMISRRWRPTMRKLPMNCPVPSLRWTR